MPRVQEPETGQDVDAEDAIAPADHCVTAEPTPSMPKRRRLLRISLWLDPHVKDRMERSARRLSTCEPGTDEYRRVQRIELNALQVFFDERARLLRSTSAEDNVGRDAVRSKLIRTTNKMRQASMAAQPFQTRQERQIPHAVAAPPQVAPGDSASCASAATPIDEADRNLGNVLKLLIPHALSFQEVHQALEDTRAAEGTQAWLTSVRRMELPPCPSVQRRGNWIAQAFSCDELCLLRLTKEHHRSDDPSQRLDWRRASITYTRSWPRPSRRSGPTHSSSPETTRRSATEQRR